MTTELPSFSIVINTLNRAAYLGDAITGVLQLDYPAFELVVVNGPSTDDTAQVLKRWAGQIKVGDCAVPNLSVSRNVGIAAAAGDVVAFIDDDAVPHPEWLMRLARRYADPVVGAVGGFTVDNSGVRWQVRKTICDRFGTAYSVDDFFDEAPLNVPGSPFYPSLLGTNSSFRRSGLCAIGGFDHTFAYMLDETDICLRLVDAGWQVLYEPDALVFHQFADSHVRTSARKPRTLYPSVVSKAYFATVHGRHDGPRRQGDALERFSTELFTANRWLDEHREITHEHRVSLDRDVTEGLRDGLAKAHAALAAGKSSGDLVVPTTPDPFRNIASPGEIRVALVSQGYPPDNDAGIARWTALLARGLADLGVRVHVITRAVATPWRRFRDGIWVHAVAPRVGPETEAIAADYAVPLAHARHMAAVIEELAFLKTFGLDLVSWPIWDLEALPVLDDPTLVSVLSLHTTYLQSRPFKPEWGLRVIQGSSVIDPIIAAEGAALARAPVILANSQTVITEIEAGYGLSIADRCTIVPHGTVDTLASLSVALEDKLAQARDRGGLRVLVPGRFELRKGYDLALRLVASLAGAPAIRFEFVGHEIDDEVSARALAESGVAMDALANSTFHGKVSREALDRYYAEADLVLMLSRFESFGLVAIEAMAAGAPVLALAGGALPEVVEHERSGWIFNEDANFVADAGALLRALAADRERVEQAAHSARAAFAARFSIPAMAQGVLAAYRAALAAREKAA